MSDSDHPRVVTVLSRRGRTIGAALAGIVAGALFFMTLATPEVPALTPFERWLVNLVGALVGWTYGTVGFSLAAGTDSEFYPPVPEMFVVAGAALVLVFNGVLVSDPAVSLLLRGVGHALLGGLAVYAGWALYHSPWAHYRSRES